MGAGEDHESGPRDPRGDPPQVQRRHNRIPGAGCSQSGRGEPAQLAVIAVAAQPGILGRYLGTCGCRGDVEVIRDLAAATGAFEAAQEPSALGLAVRGIELAEDLRLGGVGLAVDRLSFGGAEYGMVATGIGTGEDQTGDALGMVDGKALGDEAAHRPAEDVRSGQADRAHQAGSHIGERVEGAPVPGAR